MYNCKLQLMRYSLAGHFLALWHKQLLWGAKLLDPVPEKKNQASCSWRQPTLHGSKAVCGKFTYSLCSCYNVQHSQLIVTCSPRVVLADGSQGQLPWPQHFFLEGGQSLIALPHKGRWERTANSGCCLCLPCLRLGQLPSSGRNGSQHLAEGEGHLLLGPGSWHWLWTFAQGYRITKTAGPCCLFGGGLMLESLDCCLLLAHCRLGQKKRYNILGEGPSKYACVNMHVKHNWY